MVIIRIITLLLFNTSSISSWRAFTFRHFRGLLLAGRRIARAFSSEKSWFLLNRWLMSLQTISSLGPASFWCLNQILILTSQRTSFSHHKLWITRHNIVIFSYDNWLPFCINCFILSATNWHHHHLLMTTHHYRSLIDWSIAAVSRTQTFLQTSFFWATFEIFIVFLIIYLTFFLRIGWSCLMLKRF